MFKLFLALILFFAGAGFHQSSGPSKSISFLEDFPFEQAYATERTNLKPLVSFTATSTSTKVIESNAYRVYLLVQNRGSADIYLKFGSAHDGTEGILVPAGGNYEPYVPPLGALYIKSSSGSQSVTVYEGE